jgi:hypothetical protein
LKLSQHGVGYKSVVKAAGINKGIVQRIRSGKRERIRQSTERKILAVDRYAGQGGSIISANSTWRKITKLLDEGFTKSSLALRLGYKTPAIQLRHDFITVRNAQKVSRLYRILMVGG